MLFLNICFHGRGGGELLSHGTHQRNTDPEERVVTMSHRFVFFDHNAGTPLDDEIVELFPQWSAHYANPSSASQHGRAARHIIEMARQGIMAALHASDDSDLFFLSSASEANSWVVNNTIQAKLKQKSGKAPVTVVLSSVEHPSLISAVRFWEAQGVHVRWWPVDEKCCLDLTHTEEMLSGDVDLVCLMGANNEVGSIFPIQNIAKICREKGILVHCDATQLVGKENVNFEELGVDSLCCTGYKFYAPRGCAILIAREAMKLRPMIHGDQERGVRGGTENVYAILGFEHALQKIIPRLPSLNAHYKSLRNDLWEGLQKLYPMVCLNTPLNQSVSNTLNISFRGLEGQGLLLEFDVYGIALATGSACQAGSNDISHVIHAMHLDPLYERGSIRLSLGQGNTSEDVSYFLDTASKVFDHLRNIGTSNMSF